MPRKIPKTSPEADRYQPQGCIYRYDPDGTLSVVQEGGVGAGNGLCWSPGNDVMYFVDSYYNVSDLARLSRLLLL